MIVITAVTSQAAISNAGDPSPRDISAETMKMPDPIIEPITIAVAENRPIPCTNCGADVADRLSSRQEAELSSGTFFTKLTFVSSTAKHRESLSPLSQPIPHPRSEH